MRKTIILICFSLLLFSLSAQNFEIQLMGEINAFREASGLGTLVWDENLKELAEYYSSLMAATERVDHDLLRDDAWENAAYSFGINYTAVELLVSPKTPIPNAFTCFRALYRSPAHKEGMLTPHGKNIGIGYASLPLQSFVTVYIGEPSNWSFLNERN